MAGRIAEAASASFFVLSWIARFQHATMARAGLSASEERGHALPNHAYAANEATPEHEKESCHRGHRGRDRHERIGTDIHSLSLLRAKKERWYGLLGGAPLTACNSLVRQRYCKNRASTRRSAAYWDNRS